MMSGQKGEALIDSGQEPDKFLAGLGDLPIPEALERQLGLKLVEGKRFAPVFVIDHVEEHPLEN